MATSCWFDPGQGHQPSPQRGFGWQAIRHKHQIQFSNSRLARLANAPPPLFFERRGVRLQSLSLADVRERSAEQRR
jgi:hypothetical protein